MHFPGEELKARRIEAGLSRDDVYRKLRIPASFVRAIEESEIDRLPAMIYSVGFLHTYCELLQVDSAPYVDALEASTSKPRNFLALAQPDFFDQRPAWLNELLMWATIVSIVVLGWVAYTVVIQPTADQDRGSVRAETLDVRPLEAVGPR